jgi:ABC-type lipoprotein export system ATPase subunit
MCSGSVLQYLTENNDFMVIGVIGPPGVGKSTIMNELYGYDASSPGTIQLHFSYVLFIHYENIPICINHHSGMVCSYKHYCVHLIYS